MPPVRHLTPYLGLSEPISAILHLAAALAALAGLFALLRRGRGCGHRTAALGIFGLAAVNLFLMSGTYHSLPAADPLRPLFWRLDHAAVWILLAANFWAIRVLAVDGRLGGRWQAALWAVCLLGVGCELTAIDSLPYWISPTLYIGMGWLGLPTLLAVGRLHPEAPHAARMWAGGLIATAGGLMDAAEWPSPVPRIVEYHELLHACTAAGGAIFFLVVYSLADGAFHPAAREREGVAEPDELATEPERVRVTSGRF